MTMIYEPLPNGCLHVIGADYLVIASAWDAMHPGEPPQIMGQLLHLFEAPTSLRPPGVLHAARLGVEGESDRHVCQLARQCVLRRFQRSVTGAVSRREEIKGEG